MMQTTAKRYEVPRETGGEVKGMVLMLVCYFYGILLFLFFGALTTIGQLLLKKGELFFADFFTDQEYVISM